MNLVERWFRELTDKALRRGAFGSVPELITAIEDYFAAHNEDPKPLVWTATTESILEKVSPAASPSKQSNKPDPNCIGPARRALALALLRQLHTRTRRQLGCRGRHIAVRAACSRDRRWGVAMETAAGVDRTLSTEELSAHLPRIDVVIFAPELTDATRGTLGAESLDLLPEHAVLVNVRLGA